MEQIQNATFIIGTIFIFFPFVIWFIRNYMKYARGYVSPGFSLFWKICFHTIVTGLIIYIIGFLSLLDVL